MSRHPDTLLVHAQNQVIRERANTWPCDYCGASVGHICVNPVTRLPVLNIPAHNVRLKASGAV